jgi:hypothetical protein
MSTIGDIRVALADALKPAFDGQAFAYQLANPTPPCAQVTRGPIVYDLAMHSGVNQPTFTVVAYVALLTDQGAQMLLDEYLAPTGSKSLKQALEVDTTLGGLVQALHVTEATGEQAYPRENGGPVLGSQWTVEVWI